MRSPISIGSPRRRREISAASIAATISRPSCALERGSLPVRIALREVLQLEAQRLGRLDPRDDHVAACGR